MSMFDVGSNGNASVRELQSIIRGSDGLTYEPSRAYDEVYENIYVGEVYVQLCTDISVYCVIYFLH